MPREKADVRRSEKEAVGSRRGRPIVNGVSKRRKLILDALNDVFLEGGMNGVTMAAVACKASMSKRTAYEVFKDWGASSELTSYGSAVT